MRYTTEELLNLRKVCREAKPFFNDRYSGSDEDDKRVEDNGKFFNLSYEMMPGIIDELLSLREQKNEPA